MSVSYSAPPARQWSRLVAIAGTDAAAQGMSASASATREPFWVSNLRRMVSDSSVDPVMRRWTRELLSQRDAAMRRAAN